MKFKYWIICQLVLAAVYGLICGWLKAPLVLSCPLGIVIGWISQAIIPEPL